MWFLRISLLLQVTLLVDGCTWGKYHWEGWSSCSESCGGGKRHRTEISCLLHKKGDTQEEGCNENCYHGHPFSSGRCRCPSWRSGRCCSTCRHITIDHCKSGQQKCGGSPDNIMCTDCMDPYYSGGYGKGCKECRPIEHCRERHCTNMWNVKCDKCYNDNVFFKRTTSDTKCERLCAWNNHYCWPGTCGSSKLTKECSCSNGFKLVNNSGETSCQPKNSPVINTCLTTFIGGNGEKKQSSSSSASTECKYLQDVYGNFQVQGIQYDLNTDFTVQKTTLAKPDFIHEYNFGVIDATIYIKKTSISGGESEIHRIKSLEDRSNGINVQHVYSSERNISTTSSAYNLHDGEWLCIEFESLGGGFLTAKDMSTSSHTILSPKPYQKTKSNRRICYRHDNSPPEHCRILKSCRNSDPLYIQDRVTRDDKAEVIFHGWMDPLPTPGKPELASSIESYQVTVHETMPSKGIVQVDSSIIFTKKVNSTITSMTVPLNSTRPKLFCIVLEVKDVADNVRQTRRFVLYDNSSFIDISAVKPLIVSSAASNTKYQWQTHHNAICLSWKDHFYNQFYMDNEVLNPIEADRLGLITRSYDQTGGMIPISGTENVYGITNFKFSSSLNNGSFSAPKSVPHIRNESFCQDFSLKDGQSYLLKIQAIDIANNTNEDVVLVHIDRTVPHIKNIWLEKDGHKSLFVHDSKDLTKMNLTFDALDPHSGIINVMWAFGTSDSNTDLLSGTLKPAIVHKDSCSNTSRSCYCPDVGDCEEYKYVIPLNKLTAINKHMGDHNRNYYFTIKATNNAQLSNIEHIEILVDDSPPETGVISEGPEGQKDIDYTYEDNVIVNWHGFIDHESGIKLYRIYLARTCLDKDEVVTNNGTNAILDFAEVPYTIQNAKLQLNSSGKYFVTCFAINNAMSHSDPVCSDGITRVISPPTIRNLSILHASWSESIWCSGTEPWILESSMSKIKIDSVEACVDRCRNASIDSTLVQALPHNVVPSTEKDISDFLCKFLPMYSDDNVIYLPDDYMFLQWEKSVGESQMQDYFIGFGRDESEENSPSIIAYASTNRKTYFKRRHEGLSSRSTFYIFLKALSKSGLSRIVSIGPLLIDVTPPEQRKQITVDILKEKVRVAWDNDTFYDPEQSSQLGKIMFQFVSDQGPVTPLHEWRIEHSEDCVTCVTYPLQRLQAQDNDLGLKFYAKLFVYNNAGHFLEVISDPFRLPSRFPPGHAVVYDVDPEDDESDVLKDVDVHFTSNVLCVAWEGFKHHENLEIDIGIGLDRTHDDIVKYYSVNNTGRTCVHSSNITSGREYFVLVKAKCSGGETISSSNGLTVLKPADVLDSLNVQIGHDNGYSLVLKSNTTTGMQQNITFRAALRANTRYCLRGTDDKGRAFDLNNSQIQSKDAFVSKYRDEILGDTLAFVPIIENPVFTINTPRANASSVALSVYTCSSFTDFISPDGNISVNWHTTKDFKTSFAYEIKLHAGKASNETKEYKYPLRLFGYPNNSKSVTFENEISRGDVLRAELLLFKNGHLLGSKSSKNVTVVENMAGGNITNAKSTYNSTRNCLEMRASWDGFQSKSDIRMYSWAIASDDKAIQLLTRWNLVLTNTNNTYKVNECIRVPVYAASTMFMCVRAHTKAGSIGLSCSKIVHQRLNSFPLDVVYDFDISTHTWQNIKQMIHSNFLGEKLTDLHDNELNFGTSDSLVGAAMMYAVDRNITWYLTKTPSIPSSCQHDLNCIEETTTDTGFVVFSKDQMIINKRLYICIHADAITIHRENYDEVFEVMDACNDGFILDDHRPTPGTINVVNHNGFISSGRLEISYSDFEDNVNAVGMGYPTNISYYTVSVGSTPGSEDILPAINTSYTYLDDVLDVKDGSTLYITVTAFDHSGQNVTVVSDGLHVDRSAPETGHLKLGNALHGQHYISSHDVKLLLSNFKDIHSGIDYFGVGIGTSDNIDDVLKTARYFTDDVMFKLPAESIVEGHQYFIIVTATNKAGLTSDIVSLPFILDTTPPLPGHVLDGSSSNQKDVDFQTTSDTIQGHWFGFSDQQSKIEYYRVGLGTRPYIDDSRPFVNVGLTKVISWKGPFTIGQKYFLTVVACNGAGLCHTVSSDGIIIDNSPPITGLVTVGSGSEHEHYQRHNKSIRIHWEGFEDPHSSIQRYEACLGETPFSCDIVPMFGCLLQSSIIKTGLNIPINKPMYATVYAYNNVGLKTEQTSPVFVVDDSPPEVVIQPTFLLDYNANEGINIQWDRSVLRLFWEFKDEESPIVRHELSLLTHHEGHTPVENMKLGNINNITLTLDTDNLLHNGDTYSVVITSCNAAGHCTTATSTDLLVDSTPPFLGGFKPPMSWRNHLSSSGDQQSELMLSWYGFVDGESEIETYYITVSKTYTGHELTDGIIPVPARNTHGDVQANITINTFLHADDLLVLTIWAQNKAGLNSSMGKISVNTLLATKQANASIQNGQLEIEKHSCDVHFCNKDCTCAVLGQPCVDVGSVKPCQTQDAVSNMTITDYPTVSVYGGLRHNPQSMSASSTCLSAHWDVIHENHDNYTHDIIRYEWSAGLLGQPVGEGIFDLKSELPWNDVGRQTTFIHCLPTNHSLTHGGKYVIYVRAWFEFDLFLQFSSLPITVDHSAPAVRRGRFVKDSDSTCTEDFDFIDWTDTVTACWDGVFSEQQGDIIHYSVSLGTFPYSDDVLQTTRVGHNTIITVNQANLTHGTKYYFTVTVHNNIGVYTSVVSDGFIIDTDTPTPGIVFNTLFHKDDLFQSSNDSFTISWHGFLDHFSGIKSYLVSYTEADNTDESNMTYINVNLKTTHTFRDASLINGVEYVGVVKAIDAAGHVSASVRSSSKMVDNTPPNGYACTKYDVIEEVDHNGTGGDDVNNVTISVNFTRDSLYIVKASIRSDDAYLRATLILDTFQQRLPVTSNHDGVRQTEYSFFSPLSGQHDMTLQFESTSPVNMTTTIVRCGQMNRDNDNALLARQISPTTIAVNIVSRDEESAIHKVDVGAGSTRGGFQLQPLTRIYEGNNGVLYIDAPHKSPVHVTAIVENSAGLRTVFHSKPFNMDHTPPVIENIRASQDEGNGGHVILSANWTAIDLESGVKMCYCSLGRSALSADIVQHWRSDNVTSCTSAGIRLDHGTDVFVTVKCVNNVELSYELSSTPVVIIKSPPLVDHAKVSFVNPDRESSLRTLSASHTTYKNIQANDSHIQLQWSGFIDVSSIMNYEYRLLNKYMTVVDWTSTGTKTMASVRGFPVTLDSTYTAEVKAFNMKYASDVIRSSSLLIYKDHPKLTGAPVAITRSDRKLLIDWSRVFDHNVPLGMSMVYSLAIGSRPGFNDLAEIQRIEASSIDVTVPESTIVSPEVTEVFISVTCYFNNGLSSVYTSSYKL